MFVSAYMCIGRGAGNLEEYLSNVMIMELWIICVPLCDSITNKTLCKFQKLISKSKMGIRVT
jgi:hypothetical protein